jgi:predicted transcriptional regulator
MTPETISLGLDDETYRELEELAAVRRVTLAEAIGMAVHEAYVREQYRRAAAELDEWRNDPAHQAEVADARAEVEEPRVW